jgi:Protein of unknown function (DUF1572)
MNEKTFAENYIAEARGELAACLTRVKHCLGQLEEGQVWQRPRPAMNSVGNLLLHLSGNLRQRFLSVIHGAPDDRDRAQEFTERGPIPKAELLLRLEEAVGAADGVLAGLTAVRLGEARRYSGLRGEMEGTVLAVVLRTLLHMSGHAQEIIYATRLLLGDAYRFRIMDSRPASAETIAADDVVFERGMIPPLPAATAPVSTPAVPAANQRADEGVGTAPSESPLHDHLLELEQEFQDQEEEGKL